MMNGSLYNPHSDVKTNGAAAELCAKIDRLGADLGREIAQFATRMVRWMVGLFLASMAIFFTAITIVLNNIVPPPAPPMQVAPVIIRLSPQGVTILRAVPAARPQP